MTDELSVVAPVGSLPGCRHWQEHFGFDAGEIFTSNRLTVCKTPSNPSGVEYGCVDGLWKKDQGADANGYCATDALYAFAQASGCPQSSSVPTACRVNEPCLVDEEGVVRCITHGGEHKPAGCSWEPPETVVPAYGTCLPGGKSTKLLTAIHEERVTGTTSYFENTCVRQDEYDFGSAAATTAGSTTAGSAAAATAAAGSAAVPTAGSAAATTAAATTAAVGSAATTTAAATTAGEAATTAGTATEDIIRQIHQRRLFSTGTEQTTESGTVVSEYVAAKGPIVLPDGTGPTTLTDTIFVCKWSPPISNSVNGKPVLCNAKSVCPGGSTCDTTDNRCKVKQEGCTGDTCEMIDYLRTPSSKILDGHTTTIYNVDENPAMFHYRRVDAKDGSMGNPALHTMHAKTLHTLREFDDGEILLSMLDSKTKETSTEKTFFVQKDQTAEYYELPNSLTVAYGEMADMETTCYKKLCDHNANACPAEICKIDENQGCVPDNKANTVMVVTV